MKSGVFLQNMKQGTNQILRICLLLLIVGALLSSCGKLSDDTDQPSDPIGDSGGVPIPIELPSSAGTYSLAVYATPSTVPADMATYSVIHAELTDESNRSVENYTIEFNADLGYLENDPEGPSSLNTTTSGITTQDGSVSVYLYGSRAGSATIQATVDLNRDGITDLYATTTVILTASAGEPGIGIAGVFLTASKYVQTVEADDTGVGTPEVVNLFADVWDESGDRVGAGARVEFRLLSGAGAITRYSETDATGQAAGTFDFGERSVGSYSAQIEASTIINGQTYTSTVTLYLTVIAEVEEPPTVDITVTALPSVHSNAAGASTITVTAYATVEGVPVPNGTTIIFTRIPSTLGSLNPSYASSSGVGTSAGAAEVKWTIPNTAPVGTLSIVATTTYEGGGSGTATITVVD